MMMLSAPALGPSSKFVSAGVIDMPCSVKV